MSPIVETPSLSNIGSHVVPLFVVFQTPPEAVPTYTIFGLLSTTAKSSMRPPIVAGPISRNSRFLNLSVGFGWSAGAAFALIANAARDAAQTRIVRSAFRISFISIPLFARRGMLLRLARITHQLFWKGQTNPVQRKTCGAATSFHAYAILLCRLLSPMQLIASSCLQIPTTAC